MPASKALRVRAGRVCCSIHSTSSSAASCSSAGAGTAAPGGGATSAVGPCTRRVQRGQVAPSTACSCAGGCGGASTSLTRTARPGCGGRASRGLRCCGAKPEKAHPAPRLACRSAREALGRCSRKACGGRRPSRRPPRGGSAAASAALACEGGCCSAWKVASRGPPEKGWGCAKSTVPVCRARGARACAAAQHPASSASAGRIFLGAAWLRGLRGPWLGRGGKNWGGGPAPSKNKTKKQRDLQARGVRCSVLLACGGTHARALFSSSHRARGREREDQKGGPGDKSRHSGSTTTTPRPPHARQLKR
jgi:hypothetical protein